MPPTRKTAPEGVAIIGLQTGKGFRLSSTPPRDDDPAQAAPRGWKRGGRTTTPKTTQQRLQGGERRPQASSSLAQHSTGQSFRLKLLGTRQRPPDTSADRRQRQRTAPHPVEAPHDPRRPRAAPSHPRSGGAARQPLPRLSGGEDRPTSHARAGRRGEANEEPGLAATAAPLPTKRPAGRASGRKGRKPSHRSRSTSGDGGAASDRRGRKARRRKARGQGRCGCQARRAPTGQAVGAKAAKPGDSRSDHGPAGSSNPNAGPGPRRPTVARVEW